MGCCDRPGSSVSRPCWRRCHTCCSTTPHRLPPNWAAAAAEGGWAECEEGRAGCWTIGRAREIRCETMCSVSRCSVGRVVDSISIYRGQMDKHSRVHIGRRGVHGTSRGRKRRNAITRNTEYEQGAPCRVSICLNSCGYVHKV